MIFLFLIIGLRASFTLIYNFEAYLNTISPNWLWSPGFTTCNTNQIFGGYSKLSTNSLFNYQVNIIPHYYIEVEIYLSRLGNWLNDKMCVNIDYQGYCKQYSNSNSIATCNSMQYEEDLLVFSLGHNTRSAQIYISPALSTSDTIYWGIRQLKLYVKPCQPQCDYCRFQYDACQWKLAITSLTELSFSNFDGWMAQEPTQYGFDDQDFGYLYFEETQIYQTFQLQKHERIKIRLKSYYQSINLYIQINKSSSFFDCQQTQLSPPACETDLILNSSPKITITIFSVDFFFWYNNNIRDFEIFINENSMDLAQFSLIECKVQLSQVCLECQEGFDFDLMKEECEPICGDGLIRGNEECDYGNEIKTYSNCINCKYQCDQYCISCQFGICSYCDYGFQLNKNKICEYVINDSILIPYSGEQCDDGNNIQGDGCYEGQYECSQYCAFCNKVDCLKCQKGFNPNYGQCSSICGDQIVIKDFEECDDGNNIEYDGCFNCQFSCIKDCNICKNGQCLLKCEEGYEFQQDKCISICGDLIKTKDEECDDGNIEPFDGCFECKLSCPFNCKECLLDLCIECNQHYELENNLCKPIVNCGNGKLDFKEECDDLNLDPNDGCYNCKIEDNWNCLQIDVNQPSECQFQQSIVASLAYLNMTGNKQYVELGFSDKVKVSEFKTLSETLAFSILDLAVDKYQITLIPIYEATKEVSETIYQFEIEINEILIEQPMFKLDLGQPVYSATDQVIKQNEFTVKLQYPKYLAQAQKQQAQNLLTLNKLAIFSLAGFAGLSLLCGVLDPLLEILNILSYQQYLRYLNINFPLNLEIYFSINDLIDITPLTNLLHFDFIMNNLQVPINFKSSNGKFCNYYQNSDLFTNLQAQIIQTLLTIIIALLLSSKSTDQFFYGKILNSKLFNYSQSSASKIFHKIKFYICLGIFKTVQMILALKNIISKEGINQIFYINGWDVIFKIYIFLSSIQNQQSFIIRDYISIVVSAIILLIYFNLMFTSLFLEANFKKQTNTQIEFILKQKFIGLNIMRQLTFLFVLVQFQDSPIIQGLLISLISLFHTIVIIYFRRIQTNVNMYTNIIVEISVSLFTLSSICYAKDFSIYFSESKKILNGLVHIIALCSGILFYMIFQLLKVFKLLYNQIQHFWQKLRLADTEKNKKQMNVVMI